MANFTRRSFLGCTPALLPTVLIAQGALASSPAASAAPTGPAGPIFPTQEPDLIKEVVGVAHFGLDRIRELVGKQPSLARAAWDWGFGDWEDALGASSHVGRRDIATYLIEHGARPTIFSAAMLGQLEVVKAFIAASPGIQRTRGPHGIHLLAHAIAGGADAAPVVAFLKTVAGADDHAELVPLKDDDAKALVGAYAFGPGADQRFDIGFDTQQRLTINRPGHTQRFLMHRGSWEFHPSGAEAVRIVFEKSPTGMTLTVHDPGVVVTARRRLS